MKRWIKRWLAWLAGTRMVRVLVDHLVYPAVVGGLLDEIAPDRASPSGLVEALGWKIHSYIVLEEELRPTGRDCSGPRMLHDAETRKEFFDVLATAGIPAGDILEFGVFKGESLQLFAERFPDRRIYGFDSFEGLPEDWWTRPKGTFQTDIPRVEAPNVSLVKGMFDESVPTFLQGWSGRAAIVHIDCTLYASTMACLPAVLPRCSRGTIVIFDEYYGYPNFAQHEWRAWRELKSQLGLTATCVAYDARRVAFRIADLGKLA
jgi:predicted O-methyltransferase YrrM